MPAGLGVHSLDHGWLFGGVYATGAERPDYSEAGFGPVTLPHTVTPLSWADWDPASWERRWIYRRHLIREAPGDTRTFVDFQGVMTTATVWCNGVELATHRGGYLPFAVELTEHLVAGDNVLAVRVDATVQDVPPASVRGGADAIDYLQPGGIHREVTLRVVPQVHVADVCARPVDVLGDPSLEVLVTLDRGRDRPPATVTATLLDDTTELAQATTRADADRVTLSLAPLPAVALWSPEQPALYTVRVSVHDGDVAHAAGVRTGFREVVFTTDGLQLNGRRHPVFGLNRHGLFPYLGMAAPRRLQRRDAEILRRELSCTMVRCSHYPQSPHFLDACDELGLMVWQETPGWQHVGGRRFRELVRRDVAAMIQRDRSRPSVIAWGTRLNESGAHRELYAATRRIAAALDPTRQTTGAMDVHRARHSGEDVFGFDDYGSLDGAHRRATLRAPLAGRPYLVSEAVGALSGAPRYRFSDPPSTLALQARLHAEVHSLAATQPGCAGLLGWCAVDYASRNGGERVWRGLKTPGVLDTFRVPKPAAGLYASQAPCAPMIAPAFAWDVGPASPDGPGAAALVFTDCERLEVYIGETSTPTLTGVPDAVAFPGLAHPPVILDFPPLAGAPALRIDGLIGGRVVTTLRMSADPAHDALSLRLEDPEILADGVDAARFTLAIVDRHGNRRPLAAGLRLPVDLAASGPGDLIADTPFALGATGGVGGGFIRSRAGETGRVTLTARCPGYPSRAAVLEAVDGPPPPTPRGSGGPPVISRRSAPSSC